VNLLTDEAESERGAAGAEGRYLSGATWRLGEVEKEGEWRGAEQGAIGGSREQRVVLCLSVKRAKENTPGDELADFLMWRLHCGSELGA
jgi:hypothetical protein